ncbi:hypothetical protein [Parapedobacter sp. DT-150]|uniref:hypothetical protein n=1 Tax=Parapedobacter sp. DT-150 TaxID=3396162 RepID=UPI003F1B10A1
MKRIHAILPFLALVVAYLSSCESDAYINDGGTASPYVDMTTYDFLASHPKFDSLVAIIDKAGLKELVNSDITFFAGTNYSVVGYVSAKKQQKIVEIGNENIDFGIKDIGAEELDSLKMYMFDGPINREQMNTEGTYHMSKFGPIDNIQLMIKLRRTTDYSNFLDHVDYVNFTWVAGTLDSEEPDQNEIPTEEEDLSYDCQTSGIITTTGVVHVLSDNHRLMFNREAVASN